MNLLSQWTSQVFHVKMSRWKMHQWDRLHDAINCGTGSTYLTFSVESSLCKNYKQDRLLMLVLVHVPGSLFFILNCL